MLESLKQKFKARLEKRVIESDLDGRKIYFSKSRIPILGGEYTEVHPPVNEDNTWNIMNLLFGGWRNLVKLVIVLAIAGFVLLQFKQNFAHIEYLENLPCVKSYLANLAANPNPFSNLTLSSLP